MSRIPLTKPAPPRLSEAVEMLCALEESGQFSNFGPVNTRFEKRLLKEAFAGVGECMTVCNATTGLMLAIREAIARFPQRKRRYALMPSFTFAATAQAALWNQLEPIFCDIEPLTWAADRSSERQLLERYGDEIAVIVPYATFGYDIDLAGYEVLQQEYGIPVVVDAAASLGTTGPDGKGFGTGFSGAIVYSMHATKPFATGEGGVVYSADRQRIRTLRAMSSFGFETGRNASMIGLNGKMSEVAALLGYLRLEQFDGVMQHRSHLVSLYRELLPQLQFQPVSAGRQAHQFVPALLPRECGEFRKIIQTKLRLDGVDSGTYFSPHVAEQDFFQTWAKAGSLPVTNDVASRVLTLPLFDAMTDRQVRVVCSAVRSALAFVQTAVASTPSKSATEDPVRALSTVGV